MADEMQSVHGQTPLDRIGNTSGLNADTTKKLAELGIFDGEQLVELMGVPGTAGHLAEHLQMTPQALSDLVRKVTQALPEANREPHPRLARGPFPLGALEPTEETARETRSFLQAAPPATLPPATLPPAINHKAAMQPIQNQGQRGTCVGFGGTALTEYYWFTKGRSQKLCEDFLYAEAKKIDGSPNACGTWLVYAMRVVASLGLCTEAVWPYNPSLPCNHTGEPANARGAAAPNRANNHMLNPKDVQSMKAALAQNSNVAFCIPVFNSWYSSSSPTARTGAITMRINNEPSVGGHCMCLVGYQDNAAYPGGGYFILRNSWSTNWAYQCVYGAGYGTIPYQYIATFGNEAAAIP